MIERERDAQSTKQISCLRSPAVLIFFTLYASVLAQHNALITHLTHKTQNHVSEVEQQEPQATSWL
jgi:hypothetical protein